MKKTVVLLSVLLLAVGCGRPGTVSGVSGFSKISAASGTSSVSKVSEPSAISEVSGGSSAVSTISMTSEISKIPPVSKGAPVFKPGDTVIVENAIVFSRDEELAKAVTNTGNVVYIRQPDEMLIPGCEIAEKLAKCEADGILYIINPAEDITLPCQNPLASTRKDAPGVFCRFYFAKELFSGRRNALSDFSIKDITELDGGNEHLIRFRVQYTVTPARYAYAFSWYSLFFNKFGSMKTSELMTAEVTLVGTDGLWMPIRETLPELGDSSYPDREPTSEYLYVNGLLNIVFETDEYTYFSETHLVVDKNGKCEKDKTLTTVFAYRHSDTQVIPVITDLADTNVWYMDWSGNKVVIGSTWIPPASESRSGSIYVIDESTMKYQEITCKESYAVCDQGFYYASKYDNDYGAALYFYDYATGKITAYPEAEVYYIGDDNYMDIDYQFCYYQGKVIWNKGPKWFTLDQATGKVSEYVWK